MFEEQTTRRDRLKARLNRGFEDIGWRVAKYPVTTIVATSVVVALAGGGIFFLSVQDGYNDLWYSRQTQSWRSQQFKESRFGDAHRYETLIVEADEGESVLTREVLGDVLRLHNDIVEADTWPAVCARDWEEGPCKVTSILNVWNYDETALGDENDLLGTVSTDDLWDPRHDKPLTLESVLAGVEYEPDDKTSRGRRIAGASAMQITYAVQGGDEGARDRRRFEKHFVDTCLGAGVSDARVFCASAGSVEDEAERALDKNKYFVVIAMMTMALYVTMLLWNHDPVESRIVLGLMIIATVFQALACAFGLCGWIGVPFTTLTFLAIFVVLGIGIDDMIILVDAIDRAPPLSRTIQPEDRVGFALREVGTSILLSTCTDVVALICSAFVTLPIFRYFAVATAVAILGVFVLQLTFFTACLALNERRVAAQRYELWPCFQRAAVSSSSQSRNGASSSLQAATRHSRNSLSSDDESSSRATRSSFDRGSEDNLLKRSRDAAERRERQGQVKKRSMAKKVTDRIGRTITSSRWTARLTVVAFLVVGVIGALCAAYRLEQGADWTLYLPRDSYLIDFFHARDRTFGNVQVVDFVTGRVHVERAEHRAALEDLSRRVNALEDLSEPAYGWYDAWSASESFGGPSGDDATFESLKTFLETPEGRVFRDDVRLGDEYVVATKLVTQMRFPTAEDDQLELMDAAFKTARRVSSKSTVKVHAACEQFLWLERYRSVPRLAVTTLSSAVVGALVLCGILLPTAAAALVLVAVCLINVSIVGGMALANIHLNAISLVNLIMSVGFSVDFAAHIAFACSEQIRGGARAKDGVCLALNTMGPSILNAGCSTLLAIVALAFSQFYLYEQLSTMFFMMVASGLLHGVIFMPAIFYLVYDATTTTIIPKALTTNSPRWLPNQHIVKGWPGLASARDLGEPAKNAVPVNLFVSVDSLPQGEDLLLAPDPMLYTDTPEAADSM